MKDKPGPLEHVRRVTLRSESASGGDEYYEKRGLHEQTTVAHYKDDGSLDLEKTALDNSFRNFDQLPREQYAEMYLLANGFLQQQGEKTKEDVLAALDPVPEEESGKQVLLENWSLLYWANDIMHRYGALSLEGTAARFLFSADLAMQLSGGKDAHQDTLNAFAAAWHDWRSEIDGLHHNAVRGVRQSANLKKAAPAAAEKKQNAIAIIEKFCRTYWLARPNASARQTSKYLEQQGINAELEKQGLARYQSTTLERIVKTLKTRIQPRRKRD